MHFFAVDWSGAIQGVRRKLWIAEVHAGTLIDLSCGFDRRQAVDHLIQRARNETEVLVGLDFAFSFPAWFLNRHGVTAMPEAWELAAREGERWLAESPHPFWGRRGHPRPEPEPDQTPFRVTESDSLRVAGIGPKSVFQIGGAGAVGTGSLRGMPELARLRAAGFSVWPHDPPRLPLVVEIYPRHFTPRVNKSHLGARSLWLQTNHRELSGELARTAESCEDAFDAAASALEMARHTANSLRLPVLQREKYRLEGRIWRPLRER